MQAQYVGVDTGQVVGQCSNLAAVTWGQGAAIGGHPYRSPSAPALSCSLDAELIGRDIPLLVCNFLSGCASCCHCCKSMIDQRNSVLLVAGSTSDTCSDCSQDLKYGMYPLMLLFCLLAAVFHTRVVTAVVLRFW